MASHGRIPGLVTQDRPRAVTEPCRGHRRPVHPHVHGADARVPGTARRKPARPLRSRHRFLLRHSLCKADTASGRVSLAGQRTDRPGNDVPGSEPSPAQARTGYGCPIPRDEPAEPLSKPCVPIANATGCPACISMHYSRARKCALMPHIARPCPRFGETTAVVPGARAGRGSWIHGGGGCGRCSTGLIG